MSNFHPPRFTLQVGGNLSKIINDNSLSYWTMVYILKAHYLWFLKKV